MPTLADLLRDPACVDEAKGAILRRLEELAYPDPARASRLVELAASPWAVVTVAAWSHQQDAAYWQDRRFRTVFDAAEWLAEMHPSIDLERPYDGTSAQK